jgi:hypothetical protein
MPAAQQGGRVLLGRRQRSRSRRQQPLLLPPQRGLPAPAHAAARITGRDTHTRTQQVWCQPAPAPPGHHLTTTPAPGQAGTPSATVYTRGGRAGGRAPPTLRGRSPRQAPRRRCAASDCTCRARRAALRSRQPQPVCGRLSPDPDIDEQEWRGRRRGARRPPAAGGHPRRRALPRPCARPEAGTASFVCRRSWGHHVAASVLSSCRISERILGGFLRSVASGGVGKQFFGCVAPRCGAPLCWGHRMAC